MNGGRYVYVVYLGVIAFHRFDLNLLFISSRLKIFLSDGIHFLSGMCHTQLNPLVHSGIIAQYCVLQVSAFIVSTLKSGVKICVLLGCEAAGQNPEYKIGIPVDIGKIPNVQPPAETNR
jgi:hypothetical protein